MLEEGEKMSNWLENEKKLAQTQQGTTGTYVPPTKRQQLDKARFELQTAISKVEAAITALDQHPELEEFIDTLQKAGV